MLRRPAFVCCAVSLSFAFAGTPLAHAQTDGAPVPPPQEPPAAPTPIDPAPPPAAPAPPTPPPPGTEPAPPPATPPGSPPASPPATDAFPLTPSAPPTSKKPPPGAQTPPSATEPESPPTQPTPAEKPKRPTEGLFEEKPGAASEVRHHDDEKDEGTDQFKIGPVAGIGIPSVISFGGTLKLTRFLGAGINIGLIPKVHLSYYGKATLSYQHYDIYGRIYPFGGGFFLSGGAGYATVDGTLASSYKSPMAVGGFDTATYDGKGSVRTLMLTALIGYFYTTSIGFSFGIDAGAQIPIAPSQVSFSSTVKPPGLENFQPVKDFKKSADDSVRSSLEKIGRTPLPTLNLRIGWIL